MMSQSPNLKDFILRLLQDNGITDVEEVCFESPDSTPSMNIASEQGTAVVKFRNTDPDLHLFLKICRKNSLAAMFNQTLLTFEKERLFYDTILKSFVDFEKQYCAPADKILEIQSLFFKYYGGSYVDGDFVIVLDKFLPDQYYVTSKTNFHSFDKVHFVMKSLAVFHATSFCMKHILHVNFFEKYPILHDNCFDPKNPVAGPFFEKSYKGNLKVLKAAIKEVYENGVVTGEFGFHELKLKEDTLPRLEMLSNKVMQVIHKLQYCEEFFQLVCHGDFHMWNIAFSKDNETFGKFFDFQAIRYTSGLTDVHQYLSQVTTPNSRRLHLDEFLKTYQESFQEVCISYGLREKSLSLSQVWSEYRRTAPWGFLFGFFFILRRFVSDDFYDLFDKADNHESVGDFLYEQSDSFWALIKIYMEMVIEAEENDVIGKMEKLTSGLE